MSMNGNKYKKIVASLFTKTLSQGRRAHAFLRNRMLTEAGLVTVSLILFSASTLFLDAKIGRDLDPDSGKDWWTLSFETRDPGSLSFAIDNHSDSPEFSYEIARDKVVLDQGTVPVRKGERKIVSLPINNDTAGRTVITVESEDGSLKSVYRER
jgi:hypothetical protein